MRPLNGADEAANCRLRCTVFRGTIITLLNIFVCIEIVGRPHRTPGFSRPLLTSLFFRRTSLAAAEG